MKKFLKNPKKSVDNVKFIVYNSTRWLRDNDLVRSSKQQRVGRRSIQRLKEWFHQMEV